MNNDLGNFQNGVDVICNGCTTYGSTPSTNTPNDIVTAISNIYTNRYNSGYNSGVTAGRADTPGTATAAQITKGYTAWVNGVQITGTRPAPVTTLSGIVNTSKGWDTTSWTGTVTFSTPFDNVPNVSLALSSALDGSRDVRSWVSVSLVSKAKDIFVWRVNANYERPISVSFNWVASIQ